MNDKNDIPEIAKYLKETDIELLQKGIYLGKDAKQEVNVFCKGLFIPREKYSLLVSRGYKYSEIVRTTVLLSIIATKANLIYKLDSNDYIVSVYLSDAKKKDRCIAVDGINVFRISKRQAKAGWNVQSISSSIIGSDSKLEAILSATIN